MDRDFLKGLALSGITTAAWVLVYSLAAWLLWQIQPFLVLWSLSYQDLFFTALCCFFCMGLVSNSEARRFWIQWSVLLPIMLVMPDVIRLFWGTTTLLGSSLVVPYYLAVKIPLACVVLFVALFLSKRFWPEAVINKTAPPDQVRRD